MRAASCETHGPPSSVHVVELPDPVPKDGEVVVDVAAAAVNFPDVLIVADKYQWHVDTPFVPGSEFAGTVRQLGPGAEGLRVGDRVMGASMVGAFAEQVVMRAQAVRPLPSKVDLRKAAAFGVVYKTAYHALRSIGEVQPGDWVVVLGAAGGVGLAAVELAKVLGARVLAAASTPDKLAVCAARGADETVNYVSEDLKVRIRELTGGGANVVIDPVGGDYAEAALRSTRFGGRYVCVGFAGGTIPRIPLNLVLLKGAILTGFTMEGFSRNRPEDERRDERELRELFESGRVDPYISASYSLDQVVAALSDLADRRATGKVLVEPHADRS